MTREQIYGRRPVREALRGPREVLELWVTERALRAEPWLREGANELVILDEDGKSPAQVHLVIEKAASREIVELHTP